jgi:hypothetical protein
MGRNGRPERLSTLPGPSESRGTVRIAQLHPAGLGSGERLLRPPGDGLTLLLCHQRHDTYREVVGLGHVAGDEADAPSSRCKRLLSGLFS